MVIISIPEGELESKPYSYEAKDGSGLREGTRYFDTTRWGACVVGQTKAGEPIMFGGFLKSIKGGKPSGSPAKAFGGF